MAIRNRQKEPADIASFSDPSDDRADGLVQAFPAKIIDRVVMGMADDALMALATAKADPGAFDGDGNAPYFWFAEISNNNLDSYFSRMMPSSLKNYAAEADAGVSFQNSHNRYELGMGYSIKGKYIGPGGNGTARVQAAFFTVPNLQLGEINTSQLIRGMQTGIVRDVSIGFYGGRSVCSVCGNDMWDYRECPHYPGEMVNVTDTKGVITGQRMAEELIEDAHLAEVSGVYKGSTPAAGIIKAMRAMEAGVLNPEQARILEARYRINLPGARHVFSGNRGAEVMTEEEKVAAAAETARLAEVARVAEEARVTEETRVRTEAATAAERASTTIAKLPDAERAQLNTDLATLKAENERLMSEVTRLTPLADDGKRYKADAIDDAIKSGVRAFGSTGDSAFKQEQWRATLEKLSIDDVRFQREGWEAVAKKILPAGRGTTEGEEPPAATPTMRVNERAYGAR